ncbi:MAG: hypothetical protein IJB52_00870 [Clostridia bacterium]|nr:hypothetical protein [Clostridia bacterium]
MKDMKRLLSILLAILMFGSSCSQKTETESEKDTAADSALISTETQPAEPMWLDNLPKDLDYDGIEVNIAYYDLFCTAELVAELTGEVVGDAVYERNHNVEERLNVKLNMINSGADWGGTASFVRNLTTSGDSTFDFVDAFQATMTGLSTDGTLANLAKSQYLEVEQPWWATDYINEMRIGNQSLFCIAGAANLGMTDNMSCIYFNKSVLNNHSDGLGVDVDSIYQLVLEQKWTLERMYTLASSVYVDTNGNGEYDNEDTYGGGSITGNHSWHLFIDAGGRFTRRDAEGIPVLCAGDEKNINIMEQIAAMYSNPNVYYAESSENGLNELIVMFTKDQLLFKTGFFQDVVKMREMESQYGILPCPKYDEMQERYLSLIHDCGTMFVVPASCKDVDFSCTILEAIASESYRIVTPAYYEIALKTKYISDSTSGKVIDMIQQGATSDFAYIFNGDFGSPMNVLVSEVLLSKSNTYASRWSRIQKKSENGLQKLLEAYTGE